MADASEEIIGAIGVSITGDYSELEASYSQAQSDAEAAGEAVAGAFNDGVSSISDAADIVTAALDPIGPAADGAGDGLDSFAESASSAGSAAEEAGGGLSGLAEQLTAVGEALVITEGLKELGTEALDAADAITHASIALTTITGSGDQAETTIQGLEQLGMADGLSMPSLLTAATRMQQILGPGADVVSELGQIANGAAVMGTDIATAATKFDQMATAGTASARTLTAIGISLQSLADAYNVVIPGSDATAASVAAMFKAMDQAQRIDVLNQALQSLGGTAAEVAQQTFGGQWQELENAWEQIMVQVGQAILPVVSDLLQLTKTDILPFVKEMVSDFNALPGPVKDAAVAVALLVAAAIPLTGIAAAAAIGINGLAEAATLLGLGASETAVAGLGEVTAGAGVVEGAAIGATEAVGTAGLAGGLAGVSAVALPVAAAVVILAAHFGDLKDTFVNVTGTAEALGQKIGSTAIPAIEQLGSEAAIAVDPTNRAQAAWALFSTAVGNVDPIKVTLQYINLLTDGVQQLAGVTPGATQMTAAMTAELNKLQTAGTTSAAATAALAASMKDAASATQGLNGGLTPLQQSIDKVVTSVATAQTKFDQARNTFNALNQSMLTGTPIYNGLVASAEEVAKAHQDMVSAATAAGVSLAPVPGSMDAITAAATKLAAQTGFVVSAQQEQANEQADATAAMDLAQNAYNQSVAKLDLLKAALDDTNAAYAAGTASRAQVLAAENNLQTAYAASQKELTGLNTTAENYAQYMAAIVPSQAQVLAGLQNLYQDLGPTVAGFSGLDTTIEALQSTMPNFGVIMTTLSSGPLAGLRSALTEASAKVADLGAQMQAGANVGQQYEKALTQQLNAQVALDQEMAVLNTGLQGATDAYSLATVAVAAAQAKVNDLTTAYQNGTATYVQVQSAQKALATAQTELNTVTGQGTTLVDSLSAAYPNLTASVDTATTALAANVTQLQSVATAVQQVESDIASAVSGLSGATSAASGGTNAGGGYNSGGPGWKVSQIGIGSFGQPIESATYTPNLTQAQFDDLVAWKGLAYAQQVEASYNELGYNDNYTPTAVTAASGASSTASSGASGSTGGEQSPIIVSGTLGGTTTTATGTTSGSGETLAQAQAGVTAAQNAIAAAMASSSTTAAQMAELQVILSQAQTTLVALQAGTTTTGTVSTGSTAGTTSVGGSSGGGTSAIDGGSYQAVTAHQAVGEVWAVTTGAASSGGGGTVSAITETISNTVNSTAGSGDLSSVTGAVGGAVQELASNGQSLLNLATAVSASTTATQQIAEAVAGLVEKIATGSTVSSQPLATATGGSGTASSVGGVIMVTGSGTGNPQGPAAPPVSTPINSVPGYNPFAPGPTSTGTNSSAQQVTINVDARGAIGINTAAMTAQISAVVSSTLVANLRAQGARF